VRERLTPRAVPLQLPIGSGYTFIGVALIQQVVSILATYVSENVAWTR
jgi:hypothetical protein